MNSTEILNPYYNKVILSDTQLNQETEIIVTDNQDFCPLIEWEEENGFGFLFFSVIDHEINGYDYFIVSYLPQLEETYEFININYQDS
jgi:hypothetical protein